jgi:hypothetical protein
MLQTFVYSASRDGAEVWDCTQLMHELHVGGSQEGRSAILGFPWTALCDALGTTPDYRSLWLPSMRAVPIGMTTARRGAWIKCALTQLHWAEECGQP